MRYFLQILFLAASIQLYPQSSTAILQKVKEQYYSAKPLQFSTVYNLYRNASAKKVYESYTGNYCKNAGNDLYLKINDTEFLVTKKVSLQVSNGEKMMLVTKPGNISKEGYDITKMLALFKTGRVKDLKSHWEIELTTKAPGVAFSKAVLFVGKDYFIQKQVYYYNTQMNFSKNLQKSDLQYPRLEILFGKPSRKAIPLSRFDTSAYFDVKGNTIRPKGSYSTYQLIDQR